MFTAEDTALSLAFSAMGFKTALIDVWSSALEPSKPDIWIRRTVRWARQTIELSRASWACSALGLKILVCRHILSYVSPIFFYFLFVIYYITVLANSYGYLYLDLKSQYFSTDRLIIDLVFPCAVMPFFLQGILYIFLLRKEAGAPIHLLIAALALGPVLQAMIILPVSAGVIASALGWKSRFVPTNLKEALVGSGKATTYFNQTVVSGSLPLALAIMLPEFAFLGPNAYVVSGYLLAPVLYLFIGL